MRGIFNIKPPLPRYQFTWDVSIVLNFLKTLYPLEGLSIKLLTLKVTALIALACAPRAQTLVSMNIDNMNIRKRDILFWFPNLLKTSKMGKRFQLVLEHYTEESLCVMHTVLFYLKCTKGLRKSRSLLVSYVTYEAVATSTVARWLKTVLTLSGIDSSLFKAHSFRSASVSAAYDGGCSLDKILKSADWKSDKNFYKFYYRAGVNTSDMSFNRAVFKQTK
jgi:hypothetical protein